MLVACVISYRVGYRIVTQLLGNEGLRLCRRYAVYKYRTAFLLDGYAHVVNAIQNVTGNCRRDDNFMTDCITAFELFTKRDDRLLKVTVNQVNRLTVDVLHTNFAFAVYVVCR